MIDHPVQLPQHFRQFVFLFCHPVGFAGQCDDFRHILFLADEADASVEGYPVNPGRYFTFFPEFGISFPQIENHFLVKVAERSVPGGIQIAYFVDNPLVFLDYREELFLYRLVDMRRIQVH